MCPPPRELPIVFRPRAGEAISSWLARIGSVYRLDSLALINETLGRAPQLLPDIDLNPTQSTLDWLCRLTRAERPVVEQCTIRGSHPQWLPDWVTLQTPSWHLQHRTTYLPTGVQFQVCLECLEEDLERGGQYIRLDWLCAAVTICSTHLSPLWPCTREGFPPFKCNNTAAGARFTIRSDGALRPAPTINQKNRNIILRLSIFEQSIKNALAGERTSDSFISPFKSKELVAVVADLAWALLLTVGHNGLRLAHHLETGTFPVPQGWRLPIQIDTLSRADLRLRRATLAVIACLLLPDFFADLARTSDYLSSTAVCTHLLRILGPRYATSLLARAHRWPILFRQRLQRAS